MSSKSDPDNSYKTLEQKLEENIQNMRDVCLMSADFQAYNANQANLDRQLIKIVDNYKNIEEVFEKLK